MRFKKRFYTKRNKNNYLKIFMLIAKKKSFILFQDLL